MQLPSSAATTNHHLFVTTLSIVVAALPSSVGDTTLASATAATVPNGAFPELRILSRRARWSRGSSAST